MSESEDGLVLAAVAGDETSLTLLLERYGVQIRQELSVGSKWQSVVDPDDVMQVTYLEAFLRIGTLKSQTAVGFAGWLRSIAENNLRDAIRAMECDKRSANIIQPQDGDSYSQLLENICAGSTTPSKVAGRREVQQFVEDALEKLPEDYEKVIRLCELECKPGPEVASIMGRSHGSIRMMLCRAKDRLREVLSAGPLVSDTA